MHKTTWKRLALALVMLALLLCANGCLVKPDTTVEEQPTDPIEVLPFETATPSPSPVPGATGGSGWQSWGSTGTVTVTATPTAAPTVQIITASPRPTQVWTVPPVVVTATPTDDGTLRNGDTGDKVRALQQQLKNLGYYTGSVDGDFGSGTEEALREFQRVNGLSVDGVAGRQTLSLLESGNARSKPTEAPTYFYATSRPTPRSYTPSTPSTYRYLQLGTNHEDVKRLEARLKELGYFTGTPNNVFDAETEAAVLAFQERNGLWVDGVAGEDTQRMLYSSSALPLGPTVVNNSSQNSTGYRTLKQGIEGDDVALLQQRLSDLYYYTGEIDGKYGSTTALAVRVFQQRNGLTVDGVAGSGTLDAVYNANALPAPTALPTATAYAASGTLELGSQGEEVYSLQERLYDLGYYTGQIHGIYDDTVAEAVRQFQTTNGLTVDGKAGTRTQRALYADDAKAAADASSLYTTLREGDSGERVSALQTLLATYGYFTGTVDGRYGGQTTLAVQQFQARNGLNADGIAGPATLQLLYEGTPVAASSGVAGQTATFATLTQGMEGADVLNMQEYLQDLGYYAGALDGTFGASTYVALRAFQANNNLPVTGVADHNTLALLYSGDGVPAQTYSVGASTSRETLRRDDEGADVQALQSRLYELGYYTGNMDGQYGASTAAAVSDFQRANGLSVDGTAGPDTQQALYAANVVAAAQSSTVASLTTVTNRTRELEEQSATGAIQASLSGGGVAASYNSKVYLNGSTGTLCVTDSGGERQLYDGPASYIHASDAGVTFVSGSRVMRVSTDGGEAQTLVEAGGIAKLAMLGETMYYLEGGMLVKMPVGGTPVVLAEDVTDFVLDVYDMNAYLASESGVFRVGLNGGAQTMLVSTPAEQVMLCDSVVFFRSGGSLYRIQNGISTLLMDAEATWMGIYRDWVYYISGDRLYRCDTTGQQNQVFYEGLTAEVSFVAGKVYIADSVGGPVVETVSVE